MTKRHADVTLRGEASIPGLELVTAPGGSQSEPAPTTELFAEGDTW